MDLNRFWVLVLLYAWGHTKDIERASVDIIEPWSIILSEVLYNILANIKRGGSSGRGNLWLAWYYVDQPPLNMSSTKAWYNIEHRSILFCDAWMISGVWAVCWARESCSPLRGYLPAGQSIEIARSLILILCWGSARLDIIWSLANIQRGCLPNGGDLPLAQYYAEQASLSIIEACSI